MRALTRRGLRVGAAKCGPDYIDPAFHAAATGRASLNLDSWAMEEGLVAGLAALAGAEADIVIAEGPWAVRRRSGVARPHRRLRRHRRRDGMAVVLVHDVSGQGQTAAAIVRGVAAHDPRVKIAAWS